MIGNDIIDLRLAAKQSNWKRHGYLEKVFTEAEQKVILNSPNPFHMVWLFWSMKESVYKVYLKSNSTRFFNPKKFECVCINDHCGSVSVANKKFKTYSSGNDFHIHTIAVDRENIAFRSEYFMLSDMGYRVQHSETYENLLFHIAQCKKLVLNELKIKKGKSGIPKFFLRDELLAIDFSISHHGGYGAYAILN